MGLALDNEQLLVTVNGGLDQSNMAVQAWSDTTYQNSWVSYDPATYPAQYMKDSFGFVHLRGTVKSGTLNQAIFTLPVGFRPTLAMLLPFKSDIVASEYIEITNDGVVAYHGVSSPTWVSLDSITFQAEQ